MHAAVITLVGLAVCSCGAVGQDARPLAPAADEILFISNRHGNYEIYTMRSDGSKLARLTDHKAVDYSPTWSADGSRIASRPIGMGMMRSM